MKKLYILFLGILGILSFAQNSLLFNKNWKIEQVNVNGSNKDISNDQYAYFITFHSDFLFNYISTICSENFGKVNFSSSSNDFVITEAKTSSSNCQSNELNDNYSLFFTKNASANNKISYNIETVSYGYKLKLTNISGDYILYSFYTPPTDLTNTVWNISSLKIASVNYYKPTHWAGNNTTISSNGDIITSYFNAGSGSVGFYSDNRFRVLNLAITLADSFDQEINNFDGLYFGNFFSGADGRINPYSYAISNGNETLVITKYNGDTATYTKKALATSEATKSKISVYPNPSSDVIKIEKLKPNSSLELTDSSGKLIRTISNIKSDKTEINIKNLASGIYYLKVDGQSVQKIIKK